MLYAHMTLVNFARRNPNIFPGHRKFNLRNIASHQDERHGLFIGKAQRPWLVCSVDDPFQTWGSCLVQ